MFKSYLIDLSFVFLFLMLTTLFRKITVNVMIVVKVVVKFLEYLLQATPPSVDHEEKQPTVLL